MCGAKPVGSDSSPSLHLRPLGYRDFHLDNGYNRKSRKHTIRWICPRHSWANCAIRTCHRLWISTKKNQFRPEILAHASFIGNVLHDGWCGSGIVVYRIKSNDITHSIWTFATTWKGDKSTYQDTSSSYVRPMVFPRVRIII